MKLTVQTINRVVSTVDIHDSATVGELKQKISDEQSYHLKGMKLVFKGIVLDDAATLASKGVVENERIVLVGTKKPAGAKSEPPAKASTPSDKPEQAPAPPQQQQPTPAPASAPEPAASQPAKPEASEQKAQEGSSSASNAAATASSAFVTGDQMEETITMIMAMGDWERSKVVRALQAAFNNPDRAVEFLFSDSIPNDGGFGAPPMQPPPSPAGPPAVSGEGGVIAPLAPTAVGGTGAANPAAAMAGAPGRPSPEQLQQLMQQALQHPQQSSQLSPLAQALSQIPEFPQIREIINQRPNELQTVLQTLRQRSSRLYELIEQNQQEFLHILRNGLPTSSTRQEEGSAGGAPSERDREAIRNLAALVNCSEAAAAQAYLVANRNEEAAANLLLETMADEEDQGAGGQSGGGGSTGN